MVFSRLLLDEENTGLNTMGALNTTYGSRSTCVSGSSKFCCGCRLVVAVGCVVWRLFVGRVHDQRQVDSVTINICK